MTFTNINFDSDINVEYWNEIDMGSIIPLATDQIISNGFVKAFNVTVDRIDIQRKINGRDLKEIYADTFMVIARSRLFNIVKRNKRTMNERDKLLLLLLSFV